MSRWKFRVLLSVVSFLFLAAQSFALDVPKVAPGNEVLVIFSVNNTQALGGAGIVKVQLPEGFAFASVPTAYNATSDAHFTFDGFPDADGQKISDRAYVWNIDNTDAGVNPTFVAKVLVPSTLIVDGEKEIEATAVFCNATECKPYSEPILIVNSKVSSTPVVVTHNVMAADDTKNLEFIFALNGESGNYTIEISDSCLTFNNTKTEVIDYTGKDTGLNSKVAFVGNTTDKTVFKADFENATNGVQVLVNATLIADDCPLGDVVAKVYDPEGVEIGQFVIAKIATRGTEYSVSEELPVITRGSQNPVTVSFNMTELIGDEFQNGTQVKVEFPAGVNVSGVELGGSAFANATGVFDANVITISFNDTAGGNETATTLVVSANVTVPVSVAGDELKVKVYQVENTPGVVTSGEFAVAKIVDPAVDVSSESVKVGKTFSDRQFSFTFAEKYSGSLKIGGYIRVVLPEGLELVNATFKLATGSNGDLSVMDNNGVAFVDVDGNPYWVVNGTSTVNGTYTVTLTLSTKEGVELVPGEDYTFKVTADLANGETFEKEVKLFDVSEPAKVTYEKATIDPTAINAQNLGSITISELFEDALTTGNVTIAVDGVTAVYFYDTTDHQINADGSCSSGRCVYTLQVNFDDTAEVENATIVLKGVVSANEVKVKIADGNLAGDNKTGVGSVDWFVIAAACDAQHLDFCTAEEECTNAGGYWYNDTCNAEPQIICDAEHLGNCTTEEECTNAGGYWCNGVCQAEECVQPEPVPSEHKVEMNAEVNTGGVSVGEDAADGVVGGNETLSIKIEFPTYAEPVDIYVAFVTPVGTVFVRSDETLVPFDGENFVAYAENVTEVPSVDLGSYPVRFPLTGQCILPPVDYTVCTLVVPAGTSVFDFADGGAGELTCYQFRVECE